jgi:signal peptidase complex subunit 2
MTGSCFFAMIAQFAPIPFPESRPVLGICGSLYFVLSGILQFVTTYIDKDAILLTTADTEGKHKNALLKQHGLRVRTNFPRFSEYYSVILEFATPKDVSIPHFVEETWSVGNFFDKEGHFYEAGIMEETRLLFGRLDAQKYTTTDTKKKTE